MQPASPSKDLVSYVSWKEGSKPPSFHVFTDGFGYLEGW